MNAEKNHTVPSLPCAVVRSAGGFCHGVGKNVFYTSITSLIYIIDCYKKQFMISYYCFMEAAIEPETDAKTDDIFILA